MPSGGKRVGAGNKKGNVQKKTEQWNAFGAKLLGEKHLNRMHKILTNSDDDSFMKYMNNLIEYFQPKLARTELTGAEGKDFNLINVVYEDSDKATAPITEGNTEPGETV